MVYFNLMSVSVPLTPSIFLIESTDEFNASSELQEIKLETEVLHGENGDSNVSSIEITMTR